MLACVSMYISICRECLFLSILTGKQQSAMGLAKGLLSWHNVAVLAKVLLELIFFLSVTTMK